MKGIDSNPQRTSKPHPFCPVAFEKQMLYRFIMDLTYWASFSNCSSAFIQTCLSSYSIRERSPCEVLDTENHSDFPHPLSIRSSKSNRWRGSITMRLRVTFFMIIPLLHRINAISRWVHTSLSGREMCGMLIWDIWSRIFWGRWWRMGFKFHWPATIKSETLPSLTI